MLPCTIRNMHKEWGRNHTLPTYKTLKIEISIINSHFSERLNKYMKFIETTSSFHLTSHLVKIRLTL